MSFSVALAFATSSFSQAVPVCDQERLGSWVLMPEVIEERTLSEMISDSGEYLGGKAPFCMASSSLNPAGYIVLQLRYTGCLPGTIWFCETGAKTESEIPEDLSKITCQLPKQFDTCTRF